MSRVQGSRTGTRSSTRTGTRTPSRSTSTEAPKVEVPQPRAERVERPQVDRSKRPAVPKGPQRTPTQTADERKKIADERRRAILTAATERRYEELLRIRVGQIDATMLRFATREELENDSLTVCEINNPSIDLLAPSLAGTLYDRAMGPFDQVSSCDTCKNVGTNCPGHFGKILFKRKNDLGDLEDNPIYNIMYLQILIKVLNCICSDCAHLLIPVEEAKVMGLLNYSRANRLNKYERESLKVKKCSHDGNCGFHRHYAKSKTDPNLIIRYKDKDKSDVEVIYPMMAYNILNKVSDADMQTLGFEISRPEETLIFFGVIVTPPITRIPRVIGNEYQTDDITERYRNIVTANEAVKNLPYPRDITEPNLEKRKILVQKYFYEKSKSLTEKVVSIVKPSSNTGSKRPIASLYSVISGKQGVFRAILNAKTGDFCARSVASPGIDLEVDQVGIPMEWASKLTPQEIAFEGVDTNDNLYGNLAKLQQFLEQGKVTRVERKGSIFTITPTQTQGENRFIIQRGDKVFRYLQNDDMVIVNRNPSLHKQSILYHRVKLIPSLSVQLPLATTPGYNADFDGDELNIFMVQNIVANTEAQMIMSVGGSLLSESSGSALIAPTFNAPLGVYLLTLPRTHLTMQDLLDILYKTRPSSQDRGKTFMIELGGFLERCNKHNVNPLSGKSIFSLILPAELNYELKTKPIKSFLHYEATIKFKNGVERVITSAEQISDRINYAQEELLKLKSKFSNFAVKEFYDFDYKIVKTPYYENVYNQGEEDEYKVILSIVEAIEDTIIIRDGILIRGTLGKNSIGVGGDLMTYFYREFNAASALLLINSIDFIANWYLQTKYTFSIGIDDVFDVQTVRRHSAKFEEELKKVFKSVETVARPVKSTLEEVKRQTTVIDLLGKVNELGFTLTTAADSGYPTSNIRHTIQSGAKGKAENLASSLMSIGLQLKQGELISPAYGQARYSPFFPNNVYTAESMGFCKSSLSEGFTPAEALPIAAAARGDLATMKLGTPAAGYTQRRLTNLMGNLVTNAKAGVTNGSELESPLIQTFYGDCCFEAKNLYRVSTSKGEFLSPINMKQLSLQ